MKLLESHFAIVMLALATPAFGGGLDLQAVACATNTSPASSSTFNFDCTQAGTPQVLYGTLQVGETQDSVVAVDCAFDLWVAASGLPAWWHFETGGCNNLTGLSDAAVFGSSAYPGAAVCTGSLGIWGTAGTAGPAAFAPQTHGLNTGHFFISIFRSTPVKLNPSPQNYFILTLNFLSDNATQSGGSCAGCGLGATLIWNYANVINIRAASQNGPEALPYIVSGPGIKNNRLEWDGGAIIPDPVRNRTWGQLKSLYK